MIKKLVYLVIFIVSLVLVVKGNRVPDYKGLIMMFIGAAGLLSELYIYNRRYQ